MRTTRLHIFEYQQMIEDLPDDQSLQTALYNHMAECDGCRENMAIFHAIQNTARNRQSKVRWYKSTNSELIDVIKKRIHSMHFLSWLQQPFPDSAWILMTILMVLLLTWGINRLVVGHNLSPVASIQPSQFATDASTIYQSSNDCRTIIYSVNEGDTLLAISAYFEVAVDVIWRENDLDNSAVLKPGMSLYVPFCGWNPDFNPPNLKQNGVSPIDQCPSIRYTIQQGETLDEISSFFSVPVSTIRSMNHLSASNILSPGDSLFFELCRSQ